METKGIGKAVWEYSKVMRELEKARQPKPRYLIQVLMYNVNYVTQRIAPRVDEEQSLTKQYFVYDGNGFCYLATELINWNDRAQRI